MAKITINPNMVAAVKETLQGKLVEAEKALKIATAEVDSLKQSISELDAVGAAAPKGRPASKQTAPAPVAAPVASEAKGNKKGKKAGKAAKAPKVAKPAKVAKAAKPAKASKSAVSTASTGEKKKGRPSTSEWPAYILNMLRSKDELLQKSEMIDIAFTDSKWNNLSKEEVDNQITRALQRLGNGNNEIKKMSLEGTRALAYGLPEMFNGEKPLPKYASKKF